MKKIAVLMALIGLATVAVADTLPISLADAVAQKRARLKNIDTDFERWWADRWVDAARACYKLAGVDGDAAVSNMPYFGTKTESFSLTVDDCKAMAWNQSTMVMYCDVVDLEAPQLRKLSGDWPDNFFATDSVNAKSQFPVDVTMRCVIQNSVPNSVAYYSGKGSMALTLPGRKSVMLKNRKIIEPWTSHGVIKVPGYNKGGLAATVVLE